ncbi:MAG: SMP-30/gluconolactonase/LRE family protein [Betaproteobacteria bacterium]|nr:SMP-30/gluconolactonase/LRE family protein [Betaproteobacteria bacterium]
MDVAVERLTEPDCFVGESPLWRAAESALYWVDIPAKSIHRLDTASGRVASWQAGEMVACIAFRSDGTLIAGMESGVFALRLRADGGVTATALATVAMPLPNMRFNDGRCDRDGRFWAGTMHMDIPAAHAVGALYCYDEAAGLRGPVVEGLLTQNGLAWSPDGKVMYLSDSHPRSQLIWAFDYDRAAGTPGNRRVFVDMNLHPGRPDGAAVDIDGCYWTCANDAGLLLRFTSTGKLDRSIALPVKKPSMCAFGGSRFETLYVTSIRPQQAEALVDQPLAGAVFALQPGTQGIAETEFAMKH